MLIWIILASLVGLLFIARLLREDAVKPKKYPITYCYWKWMNLSDDVREDLVGSVFLVAKNQEDEFLNYLLEKDKEQIIF